MSQPVFTVRSTDPIEGAPAAAGEPSPAEGRRAPRRVCRRWTVAVADATATIEGAFDDATEQRVVWVMVNSVPGMSAVTLAEPVR
jgi:hypothetical protein